MAMVMRWVLLLAIAGCYEPAIETCSIACDPQGAACPGSLTCGDDFHCHAPDDETVCTFTLTLQLEPSDQQQGTSVLARAGEDDAPVLDCDAGECSVEIPGGTAIEIEAESPSDAMMGSDAPEVFTRLTDGCEGSNRCTLVMTEPKTVNAAFLPGRRVSIEYLGDGLGEITSEPPGINCSGPNDDIDCSVVFVADQEITLIAEAQTPSAFDGWSADICSGNDVRCVLPPADGKVVVGSTFAVDRLLVSIVGFGGEHAIDRVAITQAGTNGDTVIETCDAPGPCELFFAPNSHPTLSLVATTAPTSGQDTTRVFRQWFGSCDGSTSNVCTFTLAGDVVAVALFEDPIVVSLTAEQGGMLTVSPPSLNLDAFSCGPLQTSCSGALFHAGTVVTVSHSSSRFLAWRNPACTAAGAGPCVLTLTNAVNFHAGYRPPSVTLTVTGSGLVQISGQSGSGISSSTICTSAGGPNCKLDAQFNSNIQLKVIVANGIEFSNWQNCPDPLAIGDQLECKFTVTDDLAVGAIFKQ